MFESFFLKSKTLNLIIKYIRKVAILKRLLISFLAVIILPNIVIATFNYLTYSKEMEGTISYYHGLLTDNINSILSTKLEAYEDISYKLYKDYYLNSLLNENKTIFYNPNSTESDKAKYLENKNIINNILFNLSLDDNYITNLQIVTTYDQYSQISSDGHKKGAIISDLNTFKKSDQYINSINNNGYPLWFDESTNKNILINQNNNNQIIFNHISLTRSIIDFNTREDLGVILLNIDLRFLINIKGIKFDNKGNILFISENGTLMSLNENVNVPSISNNPDITKRIFASSQGSITENINDKPYLIYFKQLPNSPYYLIYIIDKLSVYSSSITILNLNSNVVIVCIILALVLAYLVTLSIILPLNKLKKNMDKAADKNLNIFYEDYSEDEISKLGDNFNNMIKDIDSLIETIYKAEIKEKTLNFRKKNAELNALQMQINPHFLYNTLDIIRWESMYQENGESKVSKMIEDFSKLLRLSVKKEENFVFIDAEIRHIEAYLKVINYKYSNKISLETNFDFDISKYKIAKLTFQPIVENSIIHGFIQNPTNKIITINGTTINDKIILSITDNGVGINDENLIEINSFLSNKSLSTSKIGICNVNERIKLYSSDEFGLSVYSSYGYGTTTKIIFPIYSE